ncbi:MAG: ParA family protein [Nitrospinae bacterium]|nr:ParA family protein [Nitrospinota bacterium]
MASPRAASEAILSNGGVDYSFRTIANLNLRGGIGKTTVSINTATRAAQYGFKTCLLDMDSQGSASLAFDAIPEPGDPIFYDVWQKPDETVMNSLCELDENLYLLPSSLENGLLDSALTNPASQKNAVRGVCEVLRANGFDLIVMDCPPSLGAAVISSICAADTVVIPVAPDPFSIRGLELTLGEIMSITETFGLAPPSITALFNRFDKREKMSFDALETLRRVFGDHLSPVVIRTSTDYAKALARRETIFAGFSKSQAKEDYDMFIKSLLRLDGFATRGDAGYGQG